MRKKAFSVLCCALFIMCLLLQKTSVSAADINEGIITVATISGNTGDTVIVPITIDENPGICGITVSISYDSSALEFIEDMMGNVIYEYQTKAHPDRNIIRLVTVEAGNKYNNGTLLNLKFKIADSASAGLHKIDILYNSGDFCNWKLDRIMPEIIAGGVDVNLSELNCPHQNYGEWTTAAVATCTECGYEKHICSACGHIELRETQPLGHEFSNDYTIDKEATETESGLMSRHCIRCSAVTDQLTFTLQQSETGDIDNNLYEEVPENEYISNMHKEQYPDTDTSSGGNEVGSSAPENTETPDNSITENDNTSPGSDTVFIPDIDTPLQAEQISVLQKIAEVFPDINSIIKILRYLITALFSVILI